MSELKFENELETILHLVENYNSCFLRVEKKALNQHDQNGASFMQAVLQNDASCTSETSFRNSNQNKPVWTGMRFMSSNMHCGPLPITAALQVSRYNLAGSQNSEIKQR